MGIYCVNNTFCLVILERGYCISRYEKQSECLVKFRDAEELEDLREVIDFALEVEIRSRGRDTKATSYD